MSEQTLDELRQMCDGPSDGWTQGDWCWAANDAVRIALAAEAECERLRAALRDIANGCWNPQLRAWAALGEADDE